MNWKKLKEFCNSLDEEQLKKNVILWREDESIGSIEAYSLEEDYYMEPDDEHCYPESEAVEPLENLEKAYNKRDPILHEDF